MKKITLLLATAIFSVATFAQSEKYIGVMKKNIAQIDSAFLTGKADAFLDLANTFERIGNAEKTQWLPYYYAAYCRTNFAFMQKDQSANDAVAAKATELINKADSLQPDNSEISCVKSMIASVQLMVNPQQRYMEYGMLSNNLLQKAEQQDPLNPRPHLLRGQSLKFTPPQFGGGCKTATPELQKAKEKFTNFKAASGIHPDWGKSYTEMLMKDCM